MLRQSIRQLIENGVPRENILYLDLADEQFCWLWNDKPFPILVAYFELHPQKRGSESVHCFFDEVQALIGYWSVLDR